MTGRPRWLTSRLNFLSHAANTTIHAMADAQRHSPTTRHRPTLATRRCQGCAWVLALVSLSPAVAAASNPWLTPVGGEAAISGGAVAAHGRDTGMAYYNPAGLGANTRTQFDMSTTMAVVRLRTISEAFRIDLPGGRVRSAQLASTDPLVLATSTVYTRYLGRGVTVGAGHFSNNYDFYDFGGTLQDTTSDLDYSARVQFDGWNTRHHFGPTVGWQVIPRLRLGMSVFLTYEWRRDEGRIWALSGPPGQGEQNFITADFDLKRSTYAAEAIFGLQWEFARHFHLGLAIRTPRLVAYENARRHAITTEAVELSDGSREVAFRDLSAADAPRRGRIAPMQVVLALAYAFPRERGWVSVEADYNPSLRVPHNGVDLGHLFNVRAGAKIRLNNTIYTGFGLFTDHNAETRITRFPQNNINYYGGSLGAEIRRHFKLGRNERAKDLIFATDIAFRYAAGTGTSGAVRFRVDAEHPHLLTSGIAAVDSVMFHAWSGHLGAGLYF